MSVFSIDPMSYQQPGFTGGRGSAQACVAELVCIQAACSPEAIAVADGNDVLTYAELDARAGTLAEHLRTLGVGPNVVVGLCLARSIAMVVGALGILKAGGAYLPLDPAYPIARLPFQFTDAQVPS